MLINPYDYLMESIVMSHFSIPAPLQPDTVVLISSHGSVLLGAVKT